MHAWLHPPSTPESTWLHPPSSPESTQWMFLDHQPRRAEKQRPPQRAWNRALSPDDSADSTVADATELGSRPHSGTGGDEDVHSKFERLTHLERFLHTPATPDRGTPASRQPRSGTGGFSPEARSGIGDFSPDLSAHVPSSAAASHLGGRQSAEVSREVARLKLYVEDAELLSEAAVRLLCTRCTRCTRSASTLHPLSTRSCALCRLRRRWTRAAARRASPWRTVAVRRTRGSMRRRSGSWKARCWRCSAAWPRGRRRAVAGWSASCWYGACSRVEAGAESQPRPQPRPSLNRTPVAPDLCIQLPPPSPPPQLDAPLAGGSGSGAAQPLAGCHRRVASGAAAAPRDGTPVCICIVLAMALNLALALVPCLLPCPKPWRPPAAGAAARRDTFAAPTCWRRRRAAAEVVPFGIAAVRGGLLARARAPRRRSRILTLTLVLPDPKPKPKPKSKHQTQDQTPTQNASPRLA